MNKEPQYFHEIAHAIVWQAQWGKGYDPDLMSALLCVDDAEALINIESDAVSHLASARARLNELRDKLESDRGVREASKIMEKHLKRVQSWREDMKQSKPDAAMTAWLADWLSQAGGEIPSCAVVRALVESLKFYSTILDRPLQANSLKSELMDPLYKAVKLRNERWWRRDCKSHATKVVFDGVAAGRERFKNLEAFDRAVRILSERRWKWLHLPQNIGEVKRWQGIFAKQLEDAARRIKNESLFQNKDLRIDRLNKEWGLRLREGNSASRIFDGLIDPKK